MLRLVRRNRRRLAAAAVAVAAAGAFLAWGPIGLGNGPLWLPTASGGVRKHQPALVLELTGPRRGQCWNITSVVVHYHVGIRHYAATFPQGNVITCGVGGHAPELT